MNPILLLNILGIIRHKILKRIGVDQGVEGPDDLIFGSDGSLYWTSIITGEVGRISPDGVKTSQMVKPGVNPITFSDDGRLFVALCFYGDALYELDPELINPPRLIAENLGFLNGFDFVGTPINRSYFKPTT